MRVHDPIPIRDSRTLRSRSALYFQGLFRKRENTYELQEPYLREAAEVLIAEIFRQMNEGLSTISLPSNSTIFTNVCLSHLRPNEAYNTIQRVVTDHFAAQSRVVVLGVEVDLDSGLIKRYNIELCT